MSVHLVILVNWIIKNKQKGEDGFVLCVFIFYVLIILQEPSFSKCRGLTQQLATTH